MIRCILADTDCQLRLIHASNIQVMIVHNVTPLTTDQVTDYQRDGFLVLRSCIPESDIQRLEIGFARNPAVDASLQKFTPGRFTLAHNALKDPDLGFIAEHPVILAAARTLLHDDPRLTAFVMYNRTPGGQSLPAHNDYKRWRPVGSSMNWLFAITPMTDFDRRTGPLFVAPGSHRLERVHATRERVLGVKPPVRPEDCDFIDPGITARRCANDEHAHVAQGSGERIRA